MREPDQSRTILYVIQCEARRNEDIVVSQRQWLRFITVIKLILDQQPEVCV